MLDLGDAGHLAGVRIKGQDLGISWALPHKLPFSHEILQESNSIEIEVRNLSFNRVIDPDRKEIHGKITTRLIS